MKNNVWVLSAVFAFAGTLLLAAEDPYKDWTKDQLKAEITKLKKQVEELRQKAATGSYDDSVQPTPSGEEGVLKVDDFEEERPAFGGKWWTGCDQNKMGTSITPDPFRRLKGGSSKSPGYCAGIKGRLGPNEAPWAWASLTLSLSDANGPADLGAYRAIRFYTMGDGKAHEIALKKAAVKDYAQFNAVFTAPRKWTQITLPFVRFAQPEGGVRVEKTFKDVEAITFSPGLHDAEYDFRVDDLEFIK